MLRFMTCGLFLALFAFSVGCSDKTVDKAGDAASDTGEMIKSAANDAAKNTEKAAKAMGDAIDKDTVNAEAEPN